jgi:hypothetical protein
MASCHTAFARNGPAVHLTPGLPPANDSMAGPGRKPAAHTPERQPALRGLSHHRQAGPCLCGGPRDSPPRRPHSLLGQEQLALTLRTPSQREDRHHRQGPPACQTGSRPPLPIPPDFLPPPAPQTVYGECKGDGRTGTFMTGFDASTASLRAPRARLEIAPEELHRRRVGETKADTAIHGPLLNLCAGLPARRLLPRPRPTRWRTSFCVNPSFSRPWPISSAVRN